MFKNQPIDEVSQGTPRIFIHTPEPASSAALYISMLAKALSDDGCTVHLICPANFESLHELQSQARVVAHVTLPRAIENPVGLLTKVWRNFAFLISSSVVLFTTVRRGDWINFQYVLHPPFGALFFLVARLRGAKIVLTAHDPLPHKWLLPPRLRWVEHNSLGWIYRICDRILVHSEAGRGTLLQHFQVAPERVSVVVHGPYELGHGILPMPESERLEVLMFGSLRENKCPHLAIEAVQNLHRKQVPVRLTIAGQVLNRKEQKYWDNCRSLIDRDPEAIDLIEKFIPDEQLPELFSASHCLILPYGNFHSDSGVAFMALANGRPILATAAGGLGQMIQDSKGGIAIKSATVEEVEKAILAAVELGAGQLNELGKGGMDWVLRECGWTKLSGQMRAVFASLEAKS
jgi:glycosyltransferase involved in cell wall biosynthesis